MTQTSQKYDLEERTASFGEAVIKICRTIKYNSVSTPIVSQLIRSATSIGANYMEANGASSKKDFRNKIHICKKESQETQHWLRMLSTAQPELKDELRAFWQEAHEFVLIFQKITSSLRSWTLINWMPGLRSRSYFSGVGKIENWKFCGCF